MGAVSYDRIAPVSHTQARESLARPAAPDQKVTICKCVLESRLDLVLELVTWRTDNPHRGTSLMRNSPPLGPYSRTMSRALWWS